MFDTAAITTAAQAALDEAGAVLGVMVKVHTVTVKDGITTALGFIGADVVVGVAQTPDGWCVFRSLRGAYGWSAPFPTITDAARSLTGAQ